MPYISRLFVKTAFIFLCLGIFLSCASFFYPNFFPVSIHAITLGWINNLIFGVAFWMFPRGKIKIQEKDKLTFLSFILLNSGLLLRFISEPFPLFSDFEVYFCVFFIFTVSGLLIFCLAYIA